LTVARRWDDLAVKLQPLEAPVSGKRRLVGLARPDDVFARASELLVMARATERVEEERAIMSAAGRNDRFIQLERAHE
jgi:hypothetical protein